MNRAVAACLCILAFSFYVPAYAQSETAAPEVEAPAASTPATEAEAEAASAEAAAEAASAEAAYAGTWADDAAQCVNAQDVEDAPMVISKDRFDQHEAHCEFTSVSGHGNEWKVSSKCSVQGDEQAYDFGMSLTGDKLTMIDDAGPHVYTRCP